LNIEDFLKLVKQNNLSCAIRTHATITALLHKVAHGTVPKKLQEILCSLGEDKFEAARIIGKNLVTPHKYHPVTVGKSLLEIIKGKKTRESIATQLFHMFNPKFSMGLVRKLIDHVLRETY
jgi:16S rRNA C1402 N4-methylase RsmH